VQSQPLPSTSQKVVLVIHSHFSVLQPPTGRFIYHQYPHMSNVGEREKRNLQAENVLPAGSRRTGTSESLSHQIPAKPLKSPTKSARTPAKSKVITKQKEKAKSSQSQSQSQQPIPSSQPAETCSVAKTDSVVAAPAPAHNTSHVWIYLTPKTTFLQSRIFRYIRQALYSNLTPCRAFFTSACAILLHHVATSRKSCARGPRTYCHASC